MKIFSYTVILRIASNAVYEHFAIQAIFKNPDSVCEQDLSLWGMQYHIWPEVRARCRVSQSLSKCI